MSNINNLYRKIDKLPDGHSVVRGSDRILLAIWIVSLLCSVIAFWLCPSEIWLLILPFSIAGLAYLILAKRYLRAAFGLAMCIVGWFASDYLSFEPFFFLALYLFLGVSGTGAIIDSLQRILFYAVLERIRYVNISDNPSFPSRLAAFVFNIPRDIDTRNIEADLDVSSRRLTLSEIAENIAISAVYASVLWIILSVWPLELVESWNADGGMLIAAVTVYVPLISFPLTVFRSMGVRISSSFGDFRLFEGTVAVLRHMAVPLFAVLVASLVCSIFAGSWIDALSCIICSVLALCVSVSILTLVMFYRLEATSAYAIANKWELFMPVPLLMGIRERDGEDASFPGTPERDESLSADSRSQ